MDLREARFAAAQCWAAAGSQDNAERSRRHPDLYPPLSHADVSRLCDELLLIDDATVRVLTLTAMFIRHHRTAYPGIVARGLTDERNGAMLSWRDGRIFNWKSVSQAARCYLALVVFYEGGLHFGKEVLEFLGTPTFSESAAEGVDDETYAELYGTVGWVTEPDGTEVFRKLNSEELHAQRQREAVEARLHASSQLAALACSSQELAARLEQKRAEVAAFIDQMVTDLFDDEVPFPVFYSISQVLTQLGESKSCLEIDKLLVQAVRRYIQSHGCPQSLTEYHLNSGMTTGSVSLNSLAQPRWYRRETAPTWAGSYRQMLSVPSEL